jgi:hypothetical protein
VRLEGWEYNLVLAVNAVAVATIATGKLSLDYPIDRRPNKPGY